MRQTVIEHLQAYDPEMLGVVERDGRPFSTLLEFFTVLIDTEPRAIALPRAPLSEVLGTTRPIFGAEAIEYRMPVATRVAGMLGIREYAPPTSPGMFDVLLAAPSPFVMTQSFRTSGRSVSHSDCAGGVLRYAPSRGVGIAVGERQFGVRHCGHP